MPRLAFVTSHPIQYQVPIFRCLAAHSDIEFEVLFSMIPDAAAQGAGFGVEFEWDLPLLEGYEYHVLNNVSASPGVTHFSGCDTPGVLEELRSRRIDAVIVNGWVVKSCLQTLRACRKLGIPCIVRGEANDLRPRAWWKRLLQRQLIHRYSAFLPIGTASREFYRSRGISDERMFDARYCIENERFTRAADAVASQKSDFRATWAISEGAICFLFCGKFESKKHPVELVQAVQKAVARGANLHLLMVGDGDLKPACEKIVEEQALPVTFAGFLNQTEIVNAYVAADVLALPSDHGETWGLVVNEGMACGLPAVVSDQVGCASDLILENKTGWVFPFGDWEALADRLVQASAAGPQLDEMGRQCRALVAAYSPEAAADGMLAAVEFVLNKQIAKPE